MGLYNDKGNFRVTPADGNSRGLYAPDGSFYVNIDSGNTGLYGANGCLNVTMTTPTTLTGRYAPNGNLYVSDATGYSGVYAPGGSMLVEGAVTYSPEATALFARFTTPPTNERKTLIDNLIVALKTAGTWSKLDALYLMAAANSQAAQQNWIADQYNLTLVSSPTFTSDQGFNGDGSSSYVDSNFNPTTASSPKFTQDSAYFGLWSRTSTSIASSSAGYFFSPNGTTIQMRDGSNNTVGRINQSSVLTALGGTTDGSGLFGISRSGAAAQRMARNGVNLNTGTIASAALANGTLRFGHFGTASYSNAQFAAGLIGSNFSEAEETATYNALLTYMQGVGAA